MQTEPEFLIDVDGIDRKHALYHDNPYRVWTGVTQVDIDCVGDVLARTLYGACQRFVEAMHTREWDLDGKILVGNPQQASNDDGTAVSGKVTYEIRGGFKYASPLKLIRTEIPTGLIRRDLEHRITAAEAKKSL